MRGMPQRAERPLGGAADLRPLFGSEGKPKRDWTTCLCVFAQGVVSSSVCKVIGKVCVFLVLFLFCLFF